MLNETKRTRFALYVGIVVLVFWALVPYLWMFRASVLESFAAINPSTPIIPVDPADFSIAAYLEIWEQYSFPLYFKNSIIVAVAATTISTTVSIPGAYAFARLDFPGRKLLFYTAVFTVMFPWIVLTIPVYEVFHWFDLINTLTAVIIALSIFTLPQTLWLLQGFFRQGIPQGIEEAALLDGCSELTAFFRIVLPLSLPAVAAAAMFAFITSWNNFLWVFILTNDEQYRTATVAIHYILGSDIVQQWNLLMAGVTLLVVPPVVFYGLSQRYVGEGLGGGLA